MQLRADQLPAHLERGLQPLYVLHGDAPLLVLEAADSIRKVARQRGYSERESLVVLAQFDWRQLLAAAGSMSLFSERKIIELNIPNGKPGKEGGASLQAYCRQLPASGVLTLISLPELGWQEKKAAWFAALSEAGVVLELNAPPLAELPGWVASRLRRQLQSAEPEGLRFIAERVEGNLLAAHQEIQKLALLYPQGELSLEQIRAAVLNVARYDVDSLREALLLGDSARLLRTLQGLRQEGEAPTLVLWAMSEEIRALAMLQRLHRPPNEADWRAVRVWGPRQRLLRRALQRLPEQLLNASLRQAAKIDRLIKGALAGGQADIWLEFRRLALRLSADGTAVRRNKP